MDAWEVTLSLGVGIIFLYFFKKWIDFRKLPPGPWGIPILGYLPFLMFGNPLKVFETFKLKYGKIFSLKLGKFDVVVLNDYKLIFEAYSKDVFMGRPGFEVQMYRNHGRKRGILFGEGNAWSEQRRSVIRNLRTFGFGKQTTMESLLSFEVQDIVQQFDENLGKPFNLKNTLNAAVLNSLWYLCTGSRFESNDPEFQFCVRSFTENLTKMHLTGVVFYFPWILRQDSIMKGVWKVFQETRDRIQGLVRGYVEEHKETFDPNITRDLLDALLAQQKKTSDPTSSFFGDEGELNILLDLTDLFLAGAETTSTTLQWGILYLMSFPEIQRKVHDEIDSVLGTRAPSLDDKPSLLYVEATLNETHRFCSLLPFAVFHNTLAATELEGYTILKDTVVLANLRDAHFDRSYWKDPHVFRPERFIDPIQKKLIKHEQFIPFSTGKRHCLGSELAKDTLFIFFTTLLQKYNFAKEPNAPNALDLEPFSPSIILAPKPYNVIITPRN